MRFTAAIATVALLLIANAARAQDVSPAARATAERLAATSCGTCHGTGGRSTTPTFPNLAAQTALYLELQIKAFRDQTRADPDAQAYMWGMASRLNDATIAAIAVLYAAQTPALGRKGDAKLMAQGKVIFQEGIAEKGVPACATCHGAHAQGNGPFPRLAGQHAGYLIKQMLVIQSVLRLAPVMHGVIKDLSHDQINAVAAYLESVGPTSP